MPLIVHHSPDAAHVGGVQRRRSQQHCHQHETESIKGNHGPLPTRKLKYARPNAEARDPKSVSIQASEGGPRGWWERSAQWVKGGASKAMTRWEGAGPAGWK